MDVLRALTVGLHWLSLLFTQLENPSIYAGDIRNRKHQLLIECGVKALPFLTGFTLHLKSHYEFIKIHSIWPQGLK